MKLTSAYVTSKNFPGTGCNPDPRKREGRKGREERKGMDCPNAPSDFLLKVSLLGCRGITP
jgi:hypothetical protein